jgi:hypothetical protein
VWIGLWKEGVAAVVVVVGVNKEARMNNESLILLDTHGLSVHSKGRQTNERRISFFV